jgi:hypothetical protein
VTLQLKILLAMLAFLLTAALVLYGVSLLTDRAMEASRSDGYNIKVRTITYGEVQR